MKKLRAKFGAWRERRRIPDRVMSNEELTDRHRNDRRMRRLFALAFTLILVGGWAYGAQQRQDAARIVRIAERAQAAAEKAQATAQAVKLARAQAIVTQCHVDNFRRVQMGESFRQAAHALVDAATRQNPDRLATAQEQLLLNSFIEEQANAGMAPFPHRDCSMDGINLWNANPPIADLLPCVPDGKGTCV